MKNAIKLKT